MPYFRAFSAFSVTATNFMNSITFVMNYLFLISSDFSDFASLSDPQTLPFFFKRVPPWFYLRRRLLYPFNYGNKFRIFGLFSLSVTVTNFMNSSTFVWRIHRNTQLKKATLYILTNNTLKVKTSKLHFTRKAVLKS